MSEGCFNVLANVADSCRVRETEPTSQDVDIRVIAIFQRYESEIEHLQFINTELYEALKAFIDSAKLDEIGAAQPVKGGPLDMAIKAINKAEGKS